MKKELFEIPYEVMMECLTLMTTHQINATLTEVNNQLGLVTFTVSYDPHNLQQEKAATTITEIVHAFNTLSIDRYTIQF